MKSAAAVSSTAAGAAARPRAQRTWTDDADADGVGLVVVVLGDGAGLEGVGDVVSERSVVGLASAEGLRPGVAVPRDGCRGSWPARLGPAVGSASAALVGAPTSTAATSRVPARRNSAPRAVVGVDIGAFLERSRT